MFSPSHSFLGHKKGIPTDRGFSYLRFPLRPPLQSNLPYLQDRYVLHCTSAHSRAFNISSWYTARTSCTECVVKEGWRKDGASDIQLWTVESVTFQLFLRCVPIETRAHNSWIAARTVLLGWPVLTSSYQASEQNNPQSDCPPVSADNPPTIV